MKNISHFLPVEAQFDTIFAEEVQGFETQGVEARCQTQDAYIQGFKCFGTIFVVTVQNRDTQDFETQKTLVERERESFLVTYSCGCCNRIVSVLHSGNAAAFRIFVGSGNVKFIHLIYIEKII